MSNDLPVSLWRDNKGGDTCNVIEIHAMNGEAWVYLYDDDSIDMLKDIVRNDTSLSHEKRVAVAIGIQNNLRIS